jgi:hypothetical protein
MRLMVIGGLRRHQPLDPTSRTLAAPVSRPPHSDLVTSLADGLEESL